MGSGSLLARADLRIVSLPGAFSARATERDHAERDAEVGCQTAAGSSEELLPAEIEAQREEAALLTALAEAGPSAPAAPTLTSASVASQTNVSGLLALQLNNLQVLEASSPHLWEAPIDQTVQCDLDASLIPELVEAMESFELQRMRQEDHV